VSPALLLALLQGLMGAAPQILALFTQATAGKPVSMDAVATVLNQYGIDRAVLAAQIAQLEAAANIGPGSAATVVGGKAIPGTPVT
jgi:hypothetical protein